MIKNEENTQNFFKNKTVFSMQSKRGKKKAFTLVELIAVLAIIGILIAALVPKVSKYTTEAKKVKAITQARTVMMAVETYNSKNDVAVPTGTLVNDLNSTSNKYVPDSEAVEFKKGVSMVTGLTVAECDILVNERDTEFTIGSDGKVASL